MRTICVSFQAGIEISQASMAPNVTVTPLIKVHWLILVWFERKTRGQRRSKEGIILFHTNSDEFISTRWRRHPQETDASFVMVIQAQSDPLPDSPSQSTIKGRDEHMIYRLGIGYRKKEQTRSDRREVDSDYLEVRRLYCVRAASHNNHTQTYFCPSEGQYGSLWSSFSVYAKLSWRNTIIQFWIVMYGLLPLFLQL